MSDDEAPPYRVAPRDGAFAVEGPDGHVLMETRDERSADHYVTLLNRAWRAGYKAGWRAGTGAD